MFVTSTRSSKSLSFANGRHYRTTAARFEVDDPLGFAGGDKNLYRYVGNNPINQTDPTGMSAFSSLSPPKLDFSDYGSSFSNSMITLTPQQSTSILSSLTSLSYPGSSGGGLFNSTAYVAPMIPMSSSGVGVAPQLSASSNGISSPLSFSGQPAFAGGVANAVWASLATQSIPTGNLSAADAELLATRALEVHGALDSIAFKLRTTAVLGTREGLSIVAGGARDLSPAQRNALGPNEIPAKFPGVDAELTAMEYANANGLTKTALGVTRAICPECQTAIELSGGQLITEKTAVWQETSSGAGRARTASTAIGAASTAFAVYGTLREAAHMSGVAMPEDYREYNGTYYFTAPDKSVYAVQKPGWLRSFFTSPYRQYVAGPRAGQTETITSQEVDEHQAAAEKVWGRYIPPTIFSDPRFIPGTQRTTLPYFENGVQAGHIDEKGIHYSPLYHKGDMGA